MIEMMHGEITHKQISPCKQKLVVMNIIQKTTMHYVSK